MTKTPHGVGPGCTVMGADDACRGMWTALAGVAVMGTPSVAVMAASPWTVRRRLWRSAGSVQVLVGWVIQWRRMACSPSVISSHLSVLLWIARSRGRSREALRSEVVPICGGSSILVMSCARGSWRWRSRVAGEGGAWGISSSDCCGAFASFSPALMVAKM